MNECEQFVSEEKVAIQDVARHYTKIVRAKD